MASGQDLLIEQITKKWIVTRHKGATEFINVLGYEGISAQHLDLADIGEYEGVQIQEYTFGLVGGYFLIVIYLNLQTELNDVFLSLIDF